MLIIPWVNRPVIRLLVLLVGSHSRTTLVLESKPILRLLQCFTLTVVTVVGGLLSFTVDARQWTVYAKVVLTTVLHMLATLARYVALLTMLSSWVRLTCLTLRCSTVCTDAVKLPTLLVPWSREDWYRMLRSLCECVTSVLLLLS